MADETVTRTRRYRLGEDGILRVGARPGSEETLADAVENLRAASALAQGRKRPFLVEVETLRSVDREARAYYASRENTKHVSAAAVLVKSPLLRTISNFFLALNKPAFPMRLFTSEDEALAWLKSFL